MKKSIRIIIAVVLSTIIIASMLLYATHVIPFGIAVIPIILIRIIVPFIPRQDSP